MHWYEKLDIVLFTYSLPLTGLFSLYVLTNAVVFPLINFHYRYPLWMLLPTVAFLVAPLLNDVITYGRQPKGKLLSYLLHSILLFGSMYFVSLQASIKSMIGKSMFHVTPKRSSGDTLRSAVLHNKWEMIFAAAISATVAVAAGSVLPVVLLVIPVIFSVYLGIMNSGDRLGPSNRGTHQLLSDHKEAVDRAQNQEAGRALDILKALSRDGEQCLRRRAPLRSTPSATASAGQIGAGTAP